MYIGLTGGMASGKSTVAKLFSDLGCYTLDADFVAKTVMEKDGAAYNSIIKNFGNKILKTDNSIDRDILRRIVIDDINKLIKLEEIVHPIVREYSLKWYKSIKGKDDKAICIYHAPLLIETGISIDFDDIILVYTSADKQLERLLKRGHPPYEEALSLIENQTKYVDKLEYASYIINNNYDEQYLESEVLRVFNLIKLFESAERINRKAERHKFG